MWRTAVVIAILVQNGVASWYRGDGLNTVMVWTFMLLFLGAVAYSERKSR
jgi:hypothetical protein